MTLLVKNLLQILYTVMLTPSVKHRLHVCLAFDQLLLVYEMLPAVALHLGHRGTDVVAASPVAVIHLAIILNE